MIRKSLVGANTLKDSPTVIREIRQRKEHHSPILAQELASHWTTKRLLTKQVDHSSQSNSHPLSLSSLPNPFTRKHLLQQTHHSFGYNSYRTQELLIFIKHLGLPSSTGRQQNPNVTHQPHMATPIDYGSTSQGWLNSYSPPTRLS